MKVSVIMPVYNTERYVWEAIESILNQTFQDFEFIIIDDCSTDSSYEICKKYAEKDSRIRVYRNDENLKIVKTMNKWIKLSKWDYIVRMDSDDISDHNRIEKLLNKIENEKDLYVLSSNLYFINEKWEKIWKRIYNKNIEKTILNESPICHACSIIKKEAFEIWWLYTEGSDLAEDYDLWLKFYSKWLKISLLDDFLYYYRISEAWNKTKNLKKQLKLTISVKENAIKNYWIKFGLNNYIRLYLEKFLYYFVPANLILKLFLLIKWKN